jgi:hypothetical protein
MKRITCDENKLSEPLIDVEEAWEELRKFVEEDEEPPQETVS